MSVLGSLYCLDGMGCILCRKHFITTKRIHFIARSPASSFCKTNSLLSEGIAHMTRWLKLDKMKQKKILDQVVDNLNWNINWNMRSFWSSLIVLEKIIFFVCRPYCAHSKLTIIESEFKSGTNIEFEFILRRKAAKTVWVQSQSPSSHLSVNKSNYICRIYLCLRLKATQLWLMEFTILLRTEGKPC